jgi:Domain of unknown function (DUF222)/HNH endonuclease
MLLGEVIELATDIHAFDVSSASLEDSNVALAQVTRLAGWLESRRLAIVGRIGETSSFPEQHIAKSSRTSQREAAKATKRAATAARSPELAASLAAGNVSGEHVDAVSKALGSIEPGARDAFNDQIAKLVPIAEHATPDEFERVVRKAVEAANLVDGEERLARQKRAARVRSWLNRETGLWHIAGQFDPETGLALHARLERMMATMFADKTPEGCPTDPEAKNDWLRAQAFIAIMNGQTIKKGAVASGVPETVVVIDTRDGSIRWDLDVDLPASAVQRFVDRSNVHFVDIHGDRINFSDGNLNLGRTSRLANRAQRRAKQAVHATCAIPGCDVRFARTKLHHIRWWRHGGPTDLANLTPVCVHHHTQIHTGHITLRLDAEGQLIVTTSEGTMTTGPPAHNAA